MTLLSAFGGGLWVLVVLPILAAIFFFYEAYRSSKSKSFRDREIGGREYFEANIPIYKLGKFWFAVALIVAAIIIFLSINADR